jgi:hypothetical protein
MLWGWNSIPYCLLDDAFHASGFFVQDPGVLKLDTVTQVIAVLSHSCFVRTIEPDVLVVLHDPGPIGTPGLTSVDLYTFRGSLMGQRKLVTFLWERPTVMSCLVSTLLMQLKIDAKKGTNATDVSSSLGVSSLPRWIEITMGLPVTVAVLLERTVNEVQFPWETLLVIDGSGSQPW